MWELGRHGESDTASSGPPSLDAEASAFGSFQGQKNGFFNNYHGRFFILFVVGFFEFEHRANNFLLIFFYFLFFIFYDFFSESIIVAKVAIISHESTRCNVVTIKLLILFIIEAFQNPEGSYVDMNMYPHGVMDYCNGLMSLHNMVGDNVYPTPTQNSYTLCYYLAVCYWIGMVEGYAACVIFELYAGGMVEGYAACVIFELYAGGMVEGYDACVIL
ncbi:hypothetical protein WN943_017070 [Citrus x changshan-huyou]